MSGRRPVARNGPIAEAAPYRAETTSRLSGLTCRGGYGRLSRAGAPRAHAMLERRAPVCEGRWGTRPAPMSEVPTAVASAVTCADCPSAAGTRHLHRPRGQAIITVY